MSIFNLDYLKSVTPGSNAFSIKIIELFLSDVPKSIINIKEALEASNWVEVYSIAHKIKPSISMLGFSGEIVDALLKINEYSKNCTNLDQIPALLYLFEKELEKAYVELKNELVELKK